MESSTAGFVVGAKEGREVPREVGVCRICSDEIGLKENGEVFVACNECGFPVCRPCYEYERREGSQTCPQCNRRYKRLKGSPRVDGDEEDEAEQDDSVEDFQNNSRKRAVLDNQAFDTQSLKSEQAHQWRTNVAAYSSFGSVAGKDLEADREMEANMEWRERLEKWKAMQEKRGLTDKEEDDYNDQEIEEDYML